MIETKMPGSAKDLRIKHFESLSLIPEEGIKTDRQMLTFLSGFTGLKYSQLLHYTPKQLCKMTELAMRAISKLDTASPLPKTLKLKGQNFYLSDPDKIGIGWHIDWSKCNIKKDPVRMACLFYLPENYDYSDQDANGNITHPIASRYDLFAEEFPLDLFMRCSAFFLVKSLRSKRRSMVLQIAERRTQERVSLAIRLINPFSGKRLSRR